MNLPVSKNLVARNSSSFNAPDPDEAAATRVMAGDRVDGSYDVRSTKDDDAARNDMPVYDDRA